MVNEIATQMHKVNAAYASTGSVNPAYEHEFSILARMRATAQADRYRRERGLPKDAKTPYDRSLSA